MVVYNNENQRIGWSSTADCTPEDHWLRPGTQPGQKVVLKSKGERLEGTSFLLVV
ncbi:hypothetical protein CCACVL1_05665 [Corchorus capsularis]|uniref:Uncharacterized protein n=1 Tax=Corchorus capsularis TaxID=210143 RepID=A0A1R3JJI4_COCAP|nr:hypothetical protein CCACVL1_05665 [Corchorus capsularis]